MKPHRILAVACVLLVASGSARLLADTLAAELVYPLTGASNVDLTKPFQWTTVSGAQSYFLVIGTGPAQADLWASGETTGTWVLVPQGLPKGRTLYTRVWTKVQGILRHSADVSFVVATPATPVATPTPTPTPIPTPTPVPTPTPTPPAPPLVLVSPSSGLPILWEGQEIVVSGNVSAITYFAPLFGAERAVVNPAPPQLIGSRVIFAKAGEYYLTLNGTYSIKVLVLAADEPISSAVVRVFDFCRANILFDTCHDDTDAPFYANQVGFAHHFFESGEPVALLCGPTHSLFQRLVTEGLGLPTRKPALVGTFRWSDENCNVTVYEFSHNPLEVYLPDQGKWALFDVNFGFLVKWLDASELATFTMSFPGPGTMGYMDLETFKTLDVYTGGPTSRLCRPTLGQDPHPPVRQRASGVPSAYAWRDSFRFYYGGVAYWGDTALFQMPHGTEFLHGDVIWASLHTDLELEQITHDYIASFGLLVTTVTPETLSQLLEAGHKAEILQEAWRNKIPASALAPVPSSGRQPAVSVPGKVSRRVGH